MKTAQGKTVSIFTGDPPTENGPCAPAEEEDVNEDTIHEVAAKVVENVVRLASQATQGNSPDTSSVNLPQQTSSGQQRRTSAESRGACLMRLPTIQIDTVPSMPPSPDLSPPNEENSFREEPLDETEIEIQFGAPSEEALDEIKKFASSYVEDLISRAMTIAEEKQASEDTAMAQDVAAQVVEEVIAKATETANERLQQSPVVTISLETLEFPSVPSIQIDTVASMPPSPAESSEEEDIQEQQRKPKAEVNGDLPKIKFRVTVEDEDKITPAPIKFSQAPEEMKEFAASYVKDIITKAISMAEEKFVPTVPFNFEDVNLMKTSGPWYIRAREALMRLLRTACFCTPRRNES